MHLRNDCQGHRIIQLGRKTPKAKELLDHLFRKPIINAQNVAELLSTSQVSAYKIIDDFEKIGILKEMTGYKRNRYFIFQEYIDQFHR